MTRRRVVRLGGRPVWSGLLIALATWIVLEVALVAVGLTGIQAGDNASVSPSEWWWSLGAGLVALGASRYGDQT